jgi:hypothetical protein
VRAHGIAEATTGVSLDHWLAAIGPIGRRTHADRRMLVTTADLCRRLPSLRAAMTTGEVSWAQVRVIVCQVQGWPRELDDEVDGAIAKAVQAAADDHPDELGHVLRWGLDRLRPRTQERAPIERSRWFLQPTLDGSGGRSYGEHTAEDFAVLETATRPGPAGRADPRRVRPGRR